MVDGMSSGGVCAVTGASGYVGSRIAGHLTRSGWEVRTLCRSPPADGGHAVHVPFDLAAGPTPGALDGVDALVHAAYDFSRRGWEEVERVNVAGTRRLLAAARAAGVRRIVHLSTVAAFPGARSVYGRAKLACEQAALADGAAVVRSGLVWGPEGAAMFGALRRAVARLFVVPLLGPADLGLAMVCEEDLAALVEQLLQRWPEGSGQVLVAASAQTMTLAQLLRSLAPPGGRRRLLPLPWRAVWAGLRALEAVGATPPFRSDSLLSLVTADRDPFARATARAERYGVAFRPYLPAT
jgi:nucleoside-diphosphate-sugar epimerase